MLCARIGGRIPSGSADGEGAVLKALQAIADSGVLDAEDTYVLQCLGVVLAAARPSCRPASPAAEATARAFRDGKVSLIEQMSDAPGIGS